MSVTVGVSVDDLGSVLVPRMYRWTILSDAEWSVRLWCLVGGRKLLWCAGALTGVRIGIAGGGLGRTAASIVVAIGHSSPSATSTRRASLCSSLCCGACVVRAGSTPPRRNTHQEPHTFHYSRQHHLCKWLEYTKFHVLNSRLDPAEYAVACKGYAESQLTR